MMANGKEINEIEIDWPKLFGKIGGIKNECRNRIVIHKEIIPIIFVPGIMGSRLKLKNPGREQSSDPRIWDPDDKWFMWTNYGKWGVEPAKRKLKIIGKSFIPGYAEVDNDNTKHSKIFADEHDTTRAKRGWGGIMWDAYGPFIKALQNLKLPKPLDYCFDIWVHAFGYNWTDSNLNSGEALKNYIDTVLYEHQNAKYCSDGTTTRICNKVIIVTHSMGGLVARSACIIHGANEKVLALIHGVQPSTGSAAAYWRMKAGFERPGFSGPNNDAWDWLKNPQKMIKRQIVDTISAWTLGTDGEEVTSILGNIPGGLELLPTPDYVDNEGSKAWLTYEGRNAEIKLPKADVYNEIYLEQGKAYRLIESRWLDPENKSSGLPEKKDPWKKYSDCLNQAKTFHSKLQSQRHPESYQFYVSCLNSADRIVLKRLGYKVDLPSPTNRGAYRTFVDDQERPVRDEYNAEVQVRMEDPKGEGDGTVPLSSGAALKLPEKMSCEILKTDSGSSFYMGHQEIFKFKKAQAFTFESICDALYKIVKEETGQQYPMTKKKAAAE